MATKKQIADLFKVSLYDAAFRRRLLSSPRKAAGVRGIKLSDAQADWFKRYKTTIVSCSRTYEKLARALGGDKVVQDSASQLERTVKEKLPPPPPT